MFDYIVSHQGETTTMKCRPEQVSNKALALLYELRLPSVSVKLRDTGRLVFRFEVNKIYG